MAIKTLDQKAQELKVGDFGTVKLIDEEITRIFKKIQKLEEEKRLLVEKRRMLQFIEELETKE